MISNRILKLVTIIMATPAIVGSCFGSEYIENAPTPHLNTRSTTIQTERSHYVNDVSSSYQDIDFKNINITSVEYLKFPTIDVKKASELRATEEHRMFSNNDWETVLMNNYSDAVEIVDMGEIKILKPGALQQYLITFDISPCVAVTLFNPENKFIGLAHLQGGPIHGKNGLSDSVLENSLLNFIDKMGIKDFAGVQVNLLGGNGSPDMLVKIINFFEEKGCVMNPHNIHPGHTTPFYVYGEGPDAEDQDIDSKNGKLNVGVTADGNLFLYSHNSLNPRHAGKMEKIYHKTRKARCDQTQAVYLKILGAHENESYKITKDKDLHQDNGFYYYSVMPGIRVLDSMKKINITGSNINEIKTVIANMTQYMEKKQFDDPLNLIAPKLSHFNNEINNFLTLQNN